MKNKGIDNIYKIIVESLGEEIFVSDGNGDVLFVNPASIEINELDIENIIGRNVRDLEREGYFSESSTLKVLRERKPVSVLQKLKNGKRIIASGVPIYNEDGTIDMVITSSQDIDAVNTLLETLDEREAEIATLRRELYKNSDFYVSDPATVKLKAAMDKVASLDVPVLITGESGTGKQVAARHIHFFGKRREKPILTVNCSSSDESALEKEIFGYEMESAGDGQTKLGKLDLASGGTLVFNNVAFLPLKLQSKLFEYLETGRFHRTGGSESVSSSARIIAITRKDLQSMCDEDTFLRSLYYKISPVHINIPPLRSRVKDIPYLSNQYVTMFNEKYHTKKILSKDALGVLTSHTWPGNLIELDRTIESAYIMTDEPVIKGDTIYTAIHGQSDVSGNKGKVYCEDIIPLKEAKHLLEEQLVKRAYEIYKTTHKTAEVLGVNQSTVSRILRKY
ncbi:MAG: sigma 54-interacting transcriptional regulator [Bacillota bacterium]|nr:sigma 54-interacting transcriptional regulator [Bacillota bacterium]